MLQPRAQVYRNMHCSFRASKKVYLLLFTVIQFGSLYLAPNFCSTVFSLLPESLIATLAASQATLCKPYKLFITMLKEVTREACVECLAMPDNSFWQASEDALPMQLVGCACTDAASWYNQAS